MPVLEKPLPSLYSFECVCKCIFNIRERQFLANHTVLFVLHAFFSCQGDEEEGCLQAEFGESGARSGEVTAPQVAVVEIDVSKAEEDAHSSRQSNSPTDNHVTVLHHKNVRKHMRKYLLLKFILRPAIFFGKTILM